MMDGDNKEHGMKWEAFSFVKVFTNVFKESNVNHCIMSGNSFPFLDWIFLIFIMKNFICLYERFMGFLVLVISISS